MTTNRPIPRVLAIVLVLALPQPARAASPPQGSSGSEAPKPPAAAPSGVAVLARAGAEGAAWALAKEAYARPSLRPPALDELRARILVGDAAPSGAPPATRDLADERASIRGDDGASRALLRTIATQLDVRALVVVEPGASGAPSARVFLAETGAFDAARYEPDPSDAPPVIQTVTSDAGATAPASATSDGGVASPVPPSQPPAAPPAIRWSGAVTSLDRVYGSGGASPLAARPPALATSPLPPPVPILPESHPFYVSPWFWGAVGAAVFGGVAVYFATRDNTTGAIHLEMQVPK